LTATNINDLGTLKGYYAHLHNCTKHAPFGVHQQHLNKDTNLHYHKQKYSPIYAFCKFSLELSHQNDATSRFFLAIAVL